MLTFRFPKRLLRFGVILFCAAALLVACNGQDGDSGDQSEDTDTVYAIGDLLVYVPAGPFTMGSPEDDPLANPDEYPEHTVRLDGFLIYRNEVTNAEYRQCVEAGQCTPPTELEEEGPSHFYGDPAYDDFPVVGVDWFQAAAYCQYADARLPTEAEWEKTARGRFGNPFPWGEDQPSCDLANMAGCRVDEDVETDMIAQYPLGESEYEAEDLAGNVWEWTLDWYDEEFYAGSPVGNPLGPEQGELKVARGGSYQDELSNLRSAARLPLDPEEAFNNVGFRCVPVGVQTGIGNGVQPPFCRSTYIPFCTPPDEGCTPTTTNGDEPGGDNQPGGGISVGGMSCPNENGTMGITVDVGEGTADDYTVQVGIYDYSCYPTEIEGRLICYGHHVTLGENVQVTVCGADGGSTAQGGLDAVELVAVNPTPSGGAQLAALQVTAPQGPTTQLAALQVNTARPSGLQAVEVNAPAVQTYGLGDVNDYCPDGYVFNQTSGDCEKPGDMDACPDGWSFNELSYQCEPNDENGCPLGTTYNPEGQSCIPDDGECPNGYYFDQETESCQPPGNNDGGACPAGYYFDTNINCCSPIPGDNFECSEGYYYNSANGQCLPTDDYGCGPNQVYNPYEGGCVPMDNNQDDCQDGQYYDTLLQSCVNESDDCPAGTSLGEDGKTCEYNGQTLGRPAAQTTPYTGPECREPGYVMTEAGYCVPEGGGQNLDCGPNAYYDTYLEQCISTGDGDECGLGYYFDQAAEVCRPTDGPGSPCGNGYAYYSELNCCVATPGNDGSSCVGDDPSAFGGLPSIQGFQSYTSPNNSNYDYGAGYCDPGSGQDCPSGYYLSENNVCLPYNDGQCPEGYTSDTPDGSCAPLQTTSSLSGFDLISLGQAAQQQTECPAGYTYNPYNGGCTPSEIDTFQNECGEGYYYDYQLNYCVPTSCDGCAVGFYYDTQEEACLPYPDQPGGETYCPPGMYYDTGQEACLSYGDTPSAGGCVTFTVFVPTCTTQTDDTTPYCPGAHHYDPITESCVDDEPDSQGGNTGPSVDCDTYSGSEADCNANGCNWVCTSLPGGGCDPKYPSYCENP